MKDVLQYYIRKFYLWRHRKYFPYWWIGVHCHHCGKNVFKHKGDYFLLKPEVWAKVVANPYTNTNHILCKHCTERLLGRKLRPEDYYVPEDEDPHGGRYE